MSNISRRSFLKVGAALSAAAAFGCTKGDEDEVYTPLSPQDDLVFDTEEKVVCSSGAYNCGSRCHHKIHVKNGRMIAMTSAGDVPYDECKELNENNPDEFVHDTLATMSEGRQVQYRACARGYSYISKTYQPDRLKYPLIRDESLGFPKGDIRGFRRATWDEALKKAVDMIVASYNASDDTNIGYVTGTGRQWIHYNLVARFRKKFPWVWFNNNESTGNTDGAKFDSIGGTSKSNSRTDRFNSKFILTWGQDNSSTTFYQVNAYWMETKIREDLKTPIIVISSTYNDAAAMLATGVKVTYKKWQPADITAVLGQETEVYQENYIDGDLPYHSYEITGGATGASITVQVPAWVACRPATDGALMVAMMYVIYKRGLYDRKFLQDACFGFFKGQEIISTAPAKCQAGMPVWAPHDGKIGDTGDQISTGKTFTGKKMAVPAGYSFEEYLESLEQSTANGGWLSSDGSDDSNKYAGVLNYAARLTGVSADIIEAIAIKYAETKPAFLEAGGGPQRAYNGLEWCWLCFCFAAMCGHTNKRGGGPGMTMYSTPDEMVYEERLSSAWNSGSSRVDPWSGATIATNLSAYPHTAITGNDWRTPEQIAEAVKLETAWYENPQTGESTYPYGMRPNGPIDVSGREKPIQLDCFVVVHANYMVSQANTNKWAVALREHLKSLIVADLHMTPTARYADVVFPIASHFESEYFGDPFIYGPTARFYHGKAIEPMYECWTEEKFEQTLWSKVNDALGISNGDISEGGIPAYFAETARPSGEATYTTRIAPSTYYKELVTENVQTPLWEELKNKGFYDLTIPADKPMVGMRDIIIPGSVDPKTNQEIPEDHKIATSTGRINFFSPFWYLRMQTLKQDPANPASAGFRTATAKYIPNREGYEKFFADIDLKNFTGFTSPNSQRTYKLLYLCNKPRYRAQSVLDNVSMIKNEVKHHGVRMNAIDAAERGIKDGDLVYVYNDRGCIKVHAEVSYRLPPGVVSVEHGVWYRPATDENEQVTIWMCKNKDNKTYEPVKVPVDLGGCANVLTDDCFTLDPTFCVQTLAAQGGPCEVSLTKPE